jgi:hypothetical protein
MAKIEQILGLDDVAAETIETVQPKRKWREQRWKQ